MSKGFLASRSVGADGRCCGRKPMVYKRPHRLFCPRCCAEYSPEGKQQQNWAWLSVEGGFAPKYPTQSPFEALLAEAECR